MKVTTKYVARSTSGCAPFQTYADHALGCARRAAANLPVQKSFAYPAGILHDFGKFQSDVQGHIRGIVPKAEHRGAGMVLIHDTVTNAIKGLQNDSMNVMAMAAGMVKRAITSIIPTTFIITTTERATSDKRSR